jgi:hypothetical protein
MTIWWGAMGQAVEGACCEDGIVEQSHPAPAINMIARAG